MIFGKNKSLVCFSPNPRAVARILCCPCAGGGASMYRRWSQLMPDVEVWVLNYPGRESRHDQPFADSVDAIVEPLLSQTDLLAGKPLLVYGHSFGALVAYRAAFRLQSGSLQPEAVLVSARRAPHLAPPKRYDHLPKAEFLAELDRFGGIPEAIRRDPEMMDFYLPIIRADLQLNDGYVNSEAEKVHAPVYLFSAQSDRVATAEELDGWRHATYSRFEHKVFEGGHFFIQEDAEGFTACIRAIMHTVLEQNDEDLIAF